MASVEVSRDAGELIAKLASQGILEVASHYDGGTFGNYHVEFAGPSGKFSITRDRCQYLLGGDLGRLRSLGLMRAFGSLAELEVAVTAYVSVAV